MARRILTLFLGAEEAQAMVGELQELRSRRRGLRALVYFWVAVLGFPVRVLMERTAEVLASSDEDTRGGRGGMDTMWKDVSHAARSVRRSPGFAVMTISILAISMGAATAIASVVRGVLLDPLPVPEPERLVTLWLDDEGRRRQRMTPGNLSDVRGLTDVFESVAGFQGATAAWSAGTESLFLRGGYVTHDYFRTLGVLPVVGRDFAPEEASLDGPSVVILGEGLWRRAFGSDPSVVGRTVRLGDTAFEVIGIMPSGVYPTEVTVGTDMPFTEANQDFFTPLRFSEELWNLRRPHVLGAVARLRDGVEPALADAALATLTARLQATDPYNRDESLVMTPFTEEVVGDVRFALLTLLGTVGLVLVIAVVNVGALFVLRGDDRGPEIDIRIAMGAPWARLTRQLVAEGLLIASVASLAALAVADWGIILMRGLVPYQIPRLEGVEIDATALASTLALGLILALGFGAAPAWRLRGSRALRETRWAGAGPSRRRLQSAVVALQAALGVVVLVGAMLLTRSFAALQSVDLGFEALEAWVVPVSGAGDRMPEVLQRVRALPGVRAAAVTYDHPLQRNWGDGFLIQGRVLRDGEDNPSGTLRPFGEGYFEAAGIRVVEGRVPDAVDLAGDARYAVVNESLRDTYFPEGGVLGSVLDVPSARRMFGEAAGSYTVIGVVRDVRFLGPEVPSEPAFYLPLSHFPVGAGTLVVRPDRPDVALAPALREAVLQAAPGAAVRSVRRLEDLRDDMLARPRFNMMLLVSFAAIGLILSGLGAYGLVGRTVVSRLREIGIRMALGADGRAVARSVLGNALRPVLLGGALGIVAAAATVRWLRSLLFEVSPGDPLSFLASAAFLLTVGVIAAIVPTVRAMGVDPARSLRSE